jgi:hypothetical protein
VELLFYVLPLIFPDTKEGLIATVISSAIGIILAALLLYGAHNVSSENNRTDYVYIKVIQYVLI